MSDLSRKMMSEAGIIARLRLGKKLPKGGTQSTGPHKVIFKADKEVTGKEYKLDDGTMKKDYVRYLFEENGEKRVYNTKKFSKDGTLSYFIQHFADINVGDELILEMKKSGVVNYIDISSVGTSKEVSVEDDEDDGPEGTIDIQ